jgi:hypothetical protein
LEQVPAGHVTLVHTPPEQLPWPLIRESAEAVVMETTELKNTSGNAITNIFIYISSLRRSQ